jgi:CheY-like chemotaxis protein
MARILLVNPNKKHCSDIKFLLHLNGYQVESCDTIDEGLNRYQIFQELGRAFDLALLVADDEQLEKLEQLEENPFFEKLIVIHEKRDRDASKTPRFPKLAICDPELVLDCVKYHLKKSPNELFSNSTYQ